MINTKHNKIALYEYIEIVEELVEYMLLISIEVDGNGVGKFVANP
tara:strand:+ start:2560 stop:2694 length:135 start_codon:yes stop_codon:yes gene_type:complete